MFSWWSMWCWDWCCWTGISQLKRKNCRKKLDDFIIRSGKSRHYRRGFFFYRRLRGLIWFKWFVSSLLFPLYFAIVFWYQVSLHCSTSVVSPKESLDTNSTVRQFCSSAVNSWRLHKPIHILKGLKPVAIYHSPLTIDPSPAKLLTLQLQRKLWISRTTSWKRSATLRW